MEEKKPLISVIVPVYNVEKYLHKCVDSILAQTLKDFELILVDDGSPDNCGAICNEYAKKDERVSVIHKPNGGVSSARNAGIEAAQGEWLCFVDGDDWVDKDYLSLFNIDGSHYDLYLQGYKEVSPDGNMICVHRFTSGIMCYGDILIESELKNIINSPCFKLFKQHIVCENRILFDENISYGEDHIFSYEYLQKTRFVKQNIGIGYNVNRGIAGSLSTRVVPFNQLYYFTEKIYALQMALIENNCDINSDSRIRSSLCKIYSQRRYLSIRKMLSDSSTNKLGESEITIIKQLIKDSSNLGIHDIGVKHYLLLFIVLALPFSIIRRIL